jgi:hypothetical protein
MDDSSDVKHYTFEELVRSGDEHSLKFHITRQGRSIVVTGVLGGVATLSKGDTLGYKDGQVWLSPKDPIRKFITEEC